MEELPVERPSSPSRASQLIEQVLERPVSHAAVFYALLYLDTAMDNKPPAVEAEIKLATDQIAAAHFWYGVYATTRELRHATSTVSMASGDGEEVTIQTVMLNIVDEVIEDDPSAEDELDTFRFTGDVDPDSAYTIGGLERAQNLARARLKPVFQVLDPPFRRKTALDILTHYAELERVSGQSPEAIFNVLEELMLDPLFETITLLETYRQLFARLDWAQGFGGEGWTGICDHLLRITDDDISLRLWTDQSWAVEHNNNGWLDKISKNQKENDVASAALANPGLPVEAVQGLLDANMRGDMGIVFDAAAQAQREYNDIQSIPINFRRWRRLI